MHLQEAGFCMLLPQFLQALHKVHRIEVQAWHCDASLQICDYRDEGGGTPYHLIKKNGRHASY